MRLYIANLAAYNSGRLIGEWLDLDDYSDADELREAIQSKVIAPYGGEEWAIHDTEDCGSWQIDEYESLDRIMAVKELADQYSIDAVTGYIDLVGAHYIDVETLESEFQDAYRGAAESGKEWAQDTVIESWQGEGSADQHPWFGYIDWDHYWHGEFECAGYRFINGHVFFAN